MKNLQYSTAVFGKKNCTIVPDAFLFGLMDLVEEYRISLGEFTSWPDTEIVKWSDIPHNIGNPRSALQKRSESLLSGPDMECHRRWTTRFNAKTGHSLHIPAARRNGL